MNVGNSAKYPSYLCGQGWSRYHIEEEDAVKMSVEEVKRRMIEKRGKGAETIYLIQRSLIFPSDV